MLMPGRRGYQAVNGSSPFAYRATVEITFTDGFESSTGDEFTASIMDESAGSGTQESFASGGYRYGFNGKENDGETGYQDYGFRIYDKRLGRFLSVDPMSKSYPYLTPYQFASNSPIGGIDLDGLEFFKKDNTQYAMDYKPVANAPGVLAKADNVAHNAMAFIWNVTLGAVAEGGKSVNNYFAGGYKEPTTNVVASFNQFQTEAAKYHTTTPIKQQLKDFGSVATDLRNYELPAQLLIAHTFSAPKINIAGVTEKSAINVRLNSAEAVNKTFTNQGLYAPYAAGTTLGEFETSNALNNIVRLSGPKNVQGSWFTTMEQIKGLSPSQLKDKFSLKYEPTQMTPVTIGKGATIRVGTAAPVKEFSATGGGFQIEVLKGQSQYGTSVPLKK